MLSPPTRKQTHEDENSPADTWHTRHTTSHCSRRCPEDSKWTLPILPAALGCTYHHHGRFTEGETGTKKLSPQLAQACRRPRGAAGVRGAGLRVVPAGRRAGGTHPGGPGAPLTFWRARARDTPGSPTSWRVFLPRTWNFCRLTFTSNGLALGLARPPRAPAGAPGALPRAPADLAFPMVTRAAPQGADEEVAAGAQAPSGDTRGPAA